MSELSTEWYWPVVERDLDVHHREAEGPAVGCIACARLDGGNIVARHRAAVNVLLETEPAAAGHRLDREPDIRELARTA